MFAVLTRRFITGLVLSLAVLITTLPLATPAEAGWRNLTDLLLADTGIYNVKISPDSRYVVFIADIDVDERYELYSAPITGTKPIKLNPPLVAGGRVQQFAITPDSQYVIYTAKQEAGESLSDLYRVPIAGGQAAKLNLAFMAGRNVRGFVIDPDNVRVVYEANQQSNEVNELFSVPIAGGMVAKLNPSLVAGGNVYGGFTIDPISDRVVYLADQEVDGRLELYTAPIAGGTSVTLNPQGWRVADFALNLQTAAVVFRTKPNGSDFYQLYMNATGGGLPTPLNFPLGSNQHVEGFHLSPDGTRVVYNVATGLSQDGDLYNVPISGGSSAPLTTADPGYGVPSHYFYITADSQRVVYYYRKNATASQVIESVAMNGGNRAILFDRGGGEPLQHMLLSPNGQWLVYNTYPSYQTYAIPTAGGTRVPLGMGLFQKITPDSSRVIFNQAQSPFDLQSVLISGGDKRNLSRANNLARAGEATISPDGRWIVFIVDDKTGRHQLRVSDGIEEPPPPPPPTGYPVYLPIIMR